MKTKNRKFIWNLLIAAFYVVWGAMLYRLFLRQAILYPGKLGNYRADLVGHIADGVTGDWYSLMELIFGILMRDLGFNEKAVGVFLAAVVLGTLWVTYRVMRRLLPQGNTVILHLMAIVCMFVMPIFIKELNPYRYLGVQSSSVWHNSTFIGMKFAAMCVLLFYYDYQEHYLEKFSARDFLLFTVLLSIANLCKPSFILAFAPAMAVMLLTDCIRTRGKTLGRQILFGIPVLLSLLVLLRQSAMLFGGENAGSSIEFAFGYSLRLRTTHPFAAPLQSSAFPLVVLLANLRDLKTDRRFRVTWLTWLFGLLEFLCLCETGSRRNHGNLSWGYCFCLFPVFVISLCWLYRDLKAVYDAYRASGDAAFFRYVRGHRECVGRLVYLAAALLLIGAHLYFGLEYFQIVYLGGSYY